MNILTKFTLNITIDNLDIIDTLLDFNYEQLYSYIVYAKYKEGMLIGWQVDYNVSETETYNTILLQSFVTDVYSIINEYLKNAESKQVIGYKQPPLNIVLEAAEPLIKKLALKQLHQWNNLEYDDLCQMGRLTVIVLYRKGYYVNKSLIEVSFINNVLMSIRKEKHKPQIVSYEALINTNCDDEMTMADVLPDQQQLDFEADMEAEEESRELAHDQSELVVDEIGKRQYEQLLREWKNRSTSSWGQATVAKLKYLFRSKK